MKRKFFIWTSGAILGTLFLSPPFLSIFNDLQIAFGNNSGLTYDNEPTLALLIFVWLVVGIVWWILLIIVSSVSYFFIPFLFMWSSILLFFSFLPYWLALIVWLIFGFFICAIYLD